jgi:AraC-like DNA-binding protein
MISITFLIACFNLFLALIMLIQNWKLNKNVIYFSFYLMIISFTSVLYDSIINGGSAHFLMLLIGNAGPLFFLIGPLFYFFIRGLVEEHNEFSDKDLIHLVPFFLNMILLIPYLFKPVEYKLEIAENSLQNLAFYMNSKIVYFPIWFNNTLRIFSMTIYILWSMMLLQKAYKTRKGALNGAIRKQYLANYRWLNAIAITSLFLVALHWGLTLYFRFDPATTQNIQDDKLFMISIVANAFFPLLILFNPGILFGLPTNNIMNPIIRPDVTDLHANSSYSVLEAADKVKTYTEYFDGLSDKIIHYIAVEKPFLKHDFVVRDLSRDFEVPHHHIQFCIKYYVGKSFKEMVNEYRINYAVELLKKSTKKQADELNNIAYASGFNKFSDFNKAFKKVEKKSLSHWLAENT